MISVLIPSFNRSKVAKSTYKLSAAAFLQHVYVVGSGKPYSFEDLPGSVVNLHRPGLSVIERLMEGLSACTYSHVVMMSDDDIIAFSTNNPANLSSDVLVLPQIVRTLNSRYWRCYDQSKFRMYSLFCKDFFWPAIKSNLVLWSAVLPYHFCKEILSIPGATVSSFLFEKMMLCAVYSKNMSIRICPNIVLTRNKKLISTDQGARDANPSLAVYCKEMHSAFEFIQDLMRETNSRHRRNNLGDYLGELERRADICTREYEDINNPFRFTVCGDAGRLPFVLDKMLIAFNQIFPPKITAPMRLYAEASDLFCVDS